MARARRVVTGLWAGIVLCLGFIVAPSLFLLLDDPALAGRLAAHFFSIATWTTLLVAPLFFYLSRELPVCRSRWLVVVAVIAAAFMHFAVGPWIGRAGWAHAAASALYVVVSVCALTVAIAQAGSARPD